MPQPVLIGNSKNYLPKNWTSFAVRYSEKSRGLATPEALDLLSKMMKMDFRERISAADALVRFRRFFEWVITR